MTDRVLLSDAGFRSKSAHALSAFFCPWPKLRSDEPRHLIFQPSPQATAFTSPLNEPVSSHPSHLPYQSCVRP